MKHEKYLLPLSVYSGFLVWYEYCKRYDWKKCLSKFSPSKKLNWATACIGNVGPQKLSYAVRYSKTLAIETVQFALHDFAISL